MKTLLLWFVVLVIGTTNLIGQTFQKLIGTTSDDLFEKSIFFSNNYFIIGQRSSMATLTRLDINGNLVWTVELPVQSKWNDIIPTTDNNLLMVGSYGANEEVLTGVIDPNGMIISVKRYNLNTTQAGIRDGLLRLYRNPAPANASFPFYATGFETTNASSNLDRAIMVTIDNNGVIKNKTTFTQNIDSQFERAINSDGTNGEMIVCGNDNLNGVTVSVSKAGVVLSGRKFNDNNFFRTILNGSSSGGTNNHILGGENAATGVGQIVKVQGSSVVYAYELTGMSTVLKLFPYGISVGFNQFIAIGRGPVNGVIKTIFIVFAENNNVLTKLKEGVFDANETLFSGGYGDIVNLPALNPHYVFLDHRLNTTKGFGGTDGFITVTNSNLENCIYKDDLNIALVAKPNLSFMSFKPDGLTTDNIPAPTFLEIRPLTSSIIDICNCNLVTEITNSNNNCGKYTFNATTTGGTAPYTYQWDINCDGSIDYTGASIMHQFSNSGTQSYCVTTKDANQCSKSFQKTIVVTGDFTPPKIICPPGITVDCNLDISNTAFTGIATATDNITPPPPVVMILNDVTTINSICQKTTIRTWKATDACGLMATCTQSIVQKDITGPVVTCPGNITVECGSDLTNPLITGNATATDNCNQVIFVSATVGNGAGTACQQEWTKVYNFRDACENKGSCTQAITTIDSKPPTMTCPPNITIQCGVNKDDLIITGKPIATDLCQGEVIPAYIDAISGTECNTIITRTWTVTDGCGNTATCVQIINQVDTKAPTIFCASNITPVECSDNPNIPDPSNITDNCGGKIIRTKVDSKIVNGCSATLVRTWTVTDQCGNSATCVQNIIMKDTKAPTITNCGLSFTGQGFLDANGKCVGQVNVITPTVIDDCDGTVTLTNSYNNTNNASGSYPAGVTIVTWTAKDDCGNMVMCTDTVRVKGCGLEQSYCGWAAATCYSAAPTDPVGVLYDVSKTAPAPIGNDWTSVANIHPLMWKKNTIGDVFGITYDNTDNVYLAATDVYQLDGGAWLAGVSGPAGKAGVYKTNLIGPNINLTSNFVTTLNANTLSNVTGNQIPNTGGIGNGIGNIAYDKFNNQFFITNLEDGRLYRVSASGTLLSSYDPFTADTPTNGLSPYGESIWGVAVNKDPATNIVKVYFARSKSNTNPKQIWSIELNGTGQFDSPPLGGSTNVYNASTKEKLEINSIPGIQLKVTDIEFSPKGTMILAERGAPHDANVFQYKFISGTWTYFNKLHVGLSNNTSQNSSAGGVDYGYIDATDKQNCEEKVWATGNCMDPQNLINSGCQVYGLEGISPLGNSYFPLNGNSDLFIDFDGNYINQQKYQIGDVDIYKCHSCNQDTTDCKKISATVTPSSSPNDSTCCYAVNIVNNESTALTSICIDLFNSPNWIINTSAINLPGYTWSTVSSIGLCIQNSSGIPLGNSNNVFEFCLTELDPTAADLQCLEVTWYKGKLQTECRDTIKTKCTPPTKKDTCFVVSKLNSLCDPENDYAYCVTLTVTNISGYPAEGFILSGLPSAYSFGNCGCGGSVYGATGWAFDWSATPLLPNASRTVCVKILSSTPILNPTQVCFGGSVEGEQACCKSPYPICVTLKPCCNPCENINVVSKPIENRDSCCYAIDLNYGCDYLLFNSVSFQINNADVHFGSYVINGSGWSLCNPPSTQEICISPALPYINSGSHPSLFQFCLTDIDDPSDMPQLVTVNFNTTGVNGKDSIMCDTTLEYNCKNIKHPCTFITNEKIECIPDSNKYRITVTVQNISNPNFVAGSLTLIPFSLTPNPVPLIPPLPNDGTTRTVTFCYMPSVFPDSDGKLIIKYKLNNVTGDSCCNGNQVLQDTLMLPDCDSMPCGYICKDDGFQFNDEGKPLGLLTGSTPTGYYPGYGKPSVVGGGCHSSAKSIELKGITRGYLGDAVGVRIIGIAGPDTIFRKGKTYCIKFCAKFSPGLANPTATIRIRATDGSPISVGSCPPPTCEIVQDRTLIVPNVWEDISIIFSPTENYTDLVISNHTTSPLDAPSIVYIDDVSIGNAMHVYDDITPPKITCPSSSIVTDTDSDCIINYTIPVIPVTDDNGIATFNCYLDGVLVSAGSIHALNNSIVHTIKCVAYDICDNKDSCSYAITVKCKTENKCICPTQIAPFVISHNNLKEEISCGKKITLDCPVTNLVISGNIQCQSSSPNLPCPANMIQWTLDRPVLADLIGSTSSAISITLNAVDVSAPGLYTMTFSTLCPDSPVPCTCVIQWVQKECENLCACDSTGQLKPNLVTNGNFTMGNVGFTSDLIYLSSCSANTYWVDDQFSDKCSLWSPTLFGNGNFLIVDGFNNGTNLNIWSQGVVLIPGKTYKLCFSTASVYGVSQQSFNLDIGIKDGVGTFYNMVSQPISNAAWTWVDHSVTFTVPSGLTGLLTLCFNQAMIVPTGFSDFGLDNICLTEDKSTPLCKCGGFTGTKFCVLGSNPILTECNLQNKIYQLPCPDTKIVNFCGKFVCNPDTCSPSSVEFILKNTNTGATIHTASLTLSASHAFTINLLSGWCNDPTVVYEITMKGLCGSDTCICKIKFKVDCPQQNLCKCDQKFFADVAQGFLQSSTVGNCLRKFEPIALCPNDKVDWYRNGTFITTTTGLTSPVINVGSGTNTVCMIVTRTESPNKICKDTFCSKTFCIPEAIANCGGIENSGLANELDDYLNVDNTMKNWMPVQGLVYAFADEGISDGNIMLIASKGQPSEVWFRWTPDVPKPQIKAINMDVESYLSTPVPAGTTLDLYGVTANGQNVWLSSNDIGGYRKGWDGSIKGGVTESTTDFVDFTIRLTTTSIEQVFVRFDNVCFDFITATYDPLSNEQIKVYPNPTTGEVTLRLNGSIPAVGQVYIMDMTGKIVNRLPLTIRNNEQTISMATYSSGVYLLRIVDSNGAAFYKKIIKVE